MPSPPPLRSLSLLDARAAVLDELASLPVPASEEVPLDESLGRVLAEPLAADRDQPPFDRVTRDGFAVRAADVAAAAADRPVALEVIGEAPPGREVALRVGPQQCVEIMTGAPLPAGADAVLMVEDTRRTSPGEVLALRAVVAAENIVARGAELAAGAVALPGRRRLDPAALALGAALGCARPRVHLRPRVAIVSTGDELVEIEQDPRPTQIRNSNRHALAAQVARAGGQPMPAPIAGDDPATLRAVIERALAGADLLLLSGGVSMGKYDFVEGVLASLGGRLVFDGVLIRPGRPLVFGRVGEVPFFGLPGNPLSAMVTFELFVRAAIDRLSGADAAPLRFLQARLAAPLRQRPVPLTALLPAELQGEGDATLVRPLPSQGSGDLASMARADCLLVVAPSTESLPAGAFVSVLPK